MSFDQIKVELVSHWGSDRNAAEAAWASSTDKSKLDGKSEDDVRRVVTGLVNLHHDTPKERLWLEFFMTMPISAERQYDKYRLTLQYQDFQLDYMMAPFGRNGITQNELSGRYRTIPNRPYRLPDDVAAVLKVSHDQDEDVVGDYDSLVDSQHEWYDHQLKILKEAEKANKITNKEYKRAREVLRGVLGTCYLTDMRIVMNMNAFEHIVNQRLAPDAQLESRYIALRMVEELRAKGVSPFMVEGMASANGWNPMVEEVKGWTE